MDDRLLQKPDVQSIQHFIPLIKRAYEIFDFLGVLLGRGMPQCGRGSQCAHAQIIVALALLIPTERVAK